MKRTIITLTVLGVALGGIMTPKAEAWGDCAQKSIASMAMQVLKDRYRDLFRSGEAAFERDVLRGAEAGQEALAGSVPLGSDAEAIQAISTEIQLLRDVQRYGISPYFAYRLGVLSSLTADVIFPYGFARDNQERMLQEQIQRDIDARIDNFAFRQASPRRTLIRDAQSYFRGHRAFYEQDKRLITDDYLTGQGYAGFLSQGAQAYFNRSVEAVADAWHTVLLSDGQPRVSTASNRQLTWYFVNEIDYLLNVRGSYNLAVRSYDHLSSVNPGLSSAYDVVGDLFYNFGMNRDMEAAVDRGVREWQRAYELAGPERSRVAAKLAGHHVRTGRQLLQRTGTDQAEENDLPSALAAFEHAMNYDRRNPEITQLIQQTQTAIAERRQRFNMTVDLIAQAERVREEGQKAREATDLQNALAKFEMAIALYEAVDDEFDDQHTAARTGIRDLNRNVTQVIEDVLGQARMAIDQGNELEEQNQFDQAVAAYERVESIVSIIPVEERPAFAQDKDEMLTLATNRIDGAKQAKMRYEAALEQQGGAPAQQAPAADDAPQAFGGFGGD
jgi:tetratricopeptide (TPR) repeat protein